MVFVVEGRNMRKGCGSYAKMVFTLVVALSAAQCTTLVRSALNRAGVHEPPTPGKSLAGETRQEPRHSSPSSRYEVVPTETWRLAIGRPALGLSRGIREDPCMPTPMGLAEVLPMPEGAPMVPLMQSGSVELFVNGWPAVYLQDAVLHGGVGIPSTMMEHTAFSRGGGCGAGMSLSLYLRLAGTSGSDPVSVLR